MMHNTFIFLIFWIVFYLFSLSYIASKNLEYDFFTLNPIIEMATLNYSINGIPTPHQRQYKNTLLIIMIIIRTVYVKVKMDKTQV